MFEIKGKYSTAKVMIDGVEQSCVSQIVNFVNHPAFTNPIAIMPDTHAGKGSVIGFTMKITDKIIPNVIGVDIGCGMRSVNIGQNIQFDLVDLNKRIRQKIPFGTEVHEQSAIHMQNDFNWKAVDKIQENFAIAYQKEFGIVPERQPYTMDWFVDKCNKIGVSVRRAISSLGSLGGGNHFIEFGVSELKKEYWFTIHSGSRNFGKCICDYWQNKASKKLRKDRVEDMRREIDVVRQHYEGDDRYRKIQEVKAKYGIGVKSTGLEWLEGEEAVGYLYDMIFAQYYAFTNRLLMANIILGILGVEAIESIETIHNYINFQDFIIRKGAITSYISEKMVIPFNMRDGILLCEGKSNAEWNESAPHGAGRMMSRSQAKKNLDLKKYEEQMTGIYSTSVCRDTLDEAPDAYKDAKIIELAIQDTATIIDRIKPIMGMKDAKGQDN